MARKSWSRRMRLLRNRIVLGSPHRQTPYQVGRLDYAPAEILLGVTSRRELVRLNSCRKEPWTVEWIERNAGPGTVLYDIGANVGAYSLVAAKAGGGGTRVFAFEPAFANYAALCENIALNGLDDAVVPLPVLLGTETGLEVLEYSETSAGAAVHSVGGSDRRRDFALDGTYRQPMLSYRLDDLVPQFGLPQPTLVKLDVDGAEAIVLRGARETLSRPELRSLLVEVDRSKEAEVLEAVDGLGLTLADRIDERHGERLESHWYAIFSRDG